MSQKKINITVDDKLLMLFRKKLFNDKEFKELCEFCSVNFSIQIGDRLKENGFIKSWKIFTLVENLFDSKGNSPEKFAHYFDVLNFKVIRIENAILFLHALINFRKTLINKGFHNLNRLLEDEYIIPIISVLREQNMSIDIIIDKLEKIGFPILGYYPNEMKLFGEELYFERVAKDGFINTDNEKIIKFMHNDFDLEAIKNKLSSQKIGDANLKTILFNLRQIDIEIFNNLDRNSIVLFSLLKSSSLEIEGYLKQIKNNGLFEQLSLLLVGSYVKQFKCIRNNQKDNEILNNVSYLLNLESTMNPFFYHICFYYFSRNYLAHNHFMTKDNFEKMVANDYKLVKELYKSIVIVSMAVQWKLIKN